MRSRLCRLVVAFAIAWGGAALAATPQPAGAFAIYKPYNALLQRYCPQKRLYFLSPGDLSDAIETFQDSLSPSQQEKIKQGQAKKATVSCAGIIAGATCGNVAFLRAADELQLLTQFAKAVCRRPKVCGAQSDCDK